MNHNRAVDVETRAEDDIGAEINALRLNCISQIVSAEPVTLKLIAILLTQGLQPERRKRRSRSPLEGKGSGA
jgi:hypothetical protein